MQLQVKYLCRIVKKKGNTIHIGKPEISTEQKIIKWRARPIPLILGSFPIYRMLFEGNAFFLLFLVTPVDLARLFLESFSQKVKFDSGQASGSGQIGQLWRWICYLVWLKYGAIWQGSQ